MFSLAMHYHPEGACCHFAPRHLATLLTSNDAAARLAASEAVVALAVGKQAVCQDALTATEPLVRALVSLLTGPETTSVQAVVAIR